MIKFTITHSDGKWTEEITEKACKFKCYLCKKEIYGKKCKFKSGDIEKEKRNYCLKCFIKDYEDGSYNYRPIGKQVNKMLKEVKKKYAVELVVEEL